MTLKLTSSWIACEGYVISAPPRLAQYYPDNLIESSKKKYYDAKTI